MAKLQNYKTTAQNKLLEKVLSQLTLPMECSFVVHTLNLLKKYRVIIVYYKVTTNWLQSDYKIKITPKINYREITGTIMP